MADADLILHLARNLQNQERRASRLSASRSKPHDGSCASLRRSANWPGTGRHGRAPLQELP